MHLKLGKRGDTIVEVLVVLAVLGLAIGTSFAIANHSLKDARDAQEHSEAVELVQQQIEDLRLVSSNSAIYTQPGNFCITNPSTPTFAVPNPSLGTGDPCIENSLYHISISYTPPPSPNSPATFFTVS